jgi:hypothetical protein
VSLNAPAAGVGSSEQAGKGGGLPGDNVMKIRSRQPPAVRAARAPIEPQHAISPL